MGMLMRRYKNSVTVVPKNNEPVKVNEEKVVNLDNNEVTDSPVEEKKYSKSDIAFMNTANLQELAESLGIENAKETSGNKLKPQIIAKLGL